MLTFLLGAAVLAALAAWTDFRTGHIPNAIPAGGLLLAIGGHFAEGVARGGFAFGAKQAGFSLGGALLAALVPALMYLRGGIGGGDVKLFAALGAMLHPLAGLEAETYAFAAAALIVPAKLAYEGKLFSTLGNTLNLVLNPLRKKENRRELPAEMATWFRLGPAIFLGVLATLLVHAPLVRMP